MSTEDPAVEGPPGDPMPDANRHAQAPSPRPGAVALIVLLGLVAGLAPGLGEVRSLRGRASAG